MVRVALDSELIKKLELTRVRLRIKARLIPQLLDQLCDKALELNTLLAFTSKNRKKNSLREFMNQLYSWEKKATKKERIMIFVFKESLSGRAIFLKSIIKRLSWTKPCTTQEAHNLIERLVKEDLVFILRNCPKCGTLLRFNSNTCEMCAHKLFSKGFDFKDKRARPRYAIQITDKGREYVKLLISEFLYIHSFLMKIFKYNP
jgi:hypothetical protein